MADQQTIGMHKGGDHRIGRAVSPPALREWRTRRRVSQLELATRAGTTQRHVSFIESGRSSPGRSMIIRLAESLEVPIRARNQDDRL